MKKIILVAAMVLGFAVAAVAQPRAIGVRVGNGGEISYQHALGANFLEVDGGLGLGFDGVFNVGATGIYNFMIAQPNWTSRGEWGFYAGPAAKIGGAGVGYYLALGAQAGLEYTFDFPLQISLDVRPTIGCAFISGTPSFYAGGAIFGGLPSLSIRYRFGR